MVKNGGTCLYKEARLNIEPAFPGSTIAFTLPASSLSTFVLRTNAKRTVITEQYVDQDEEAFARRHLATEGSMFFRRHHASPRSFLWRVLDNRKMLEIQATDLDHDYSEKLEANLTLLLQFPSPIRPFCVAFAEATDRDALTVFAITTANELYTINLHRDFFANPTASEQDVENWCKRSEPALFSGRIPYRLVALGVDDLLVTLDDGAICRMRWDKDSKFWDGVRYQHSNWSVRGLLSWKSQPTVRFDNADFSVSAAAAIALSPDEQHILSISLDHTLRAWNVSSGKLGIQMDLLGQMDAALEKPNNPYFVGPSQSKLMAVLEVSDGVKDAKYYIATYSPKQHQFKFWGIVDPDDSKHGVYDVQPDVDLVPPVDELMDTTVWTMEEFHIVVGPGRWQTTEIWIRVRSGPSSRVYYLSFNLTDPAACAQAWKNNWVSVDSGPLTMDGLKANPANPSRQSQNTAQDEPGTSEQWLDFLFYPGRFTTATLETALLLFKRGLDRSRLSRSLSRGSLKERICTAVTALSKQVHSGDLDASQFEDIAASQWQAYYGIVKDLHKRRGESLSLAFDENTAMPWLVLSDHISAIRNCSEHEITTLNTAVISASHPLTGPLQRILDQPESRDVARLLNAASSFRRRLPLFVQQEVERQIKMDLLQSRSLTIVDRMEDIENRSELLQHVSDEDLSLLLEELGTEVRDLSTDTFLRAIQTLGYEEQGYTNRRRQVARYGLNALLRVSQETLEADYSTLLDLLVLVLFMFVELEGETPEEFDASEVFVELIDQFKDCLTVSWMASTVWAHQTATGPATEMLNRALSELMKSGKKFPFTQTVLEGIYGHRALDLPFPKDLKANILTYWSRAWIASVFREQNYDSVVEDSMGILLFQKEYDLALDFAKFLPEGNWATYLKGRMHVALGENALASICFQKAAFNLCTFTSVSNKETTLTSSALGMFNVEDADSAGLVSEADRNAFSAGPARYYSHILGLFEKSRAYTYVADFARLGLRSLRGREDEELKTELLQRLFSASIQTSRFEEAYSAMSRHSDAAL